MNDSTIPSRSSQNRIPSSIQELEQSAWGQQAAQPEHQERIIKQIPRLLKKLGKKHPVALKAQEAFRLFDKGRSEGQSFLSTRNVLLLGASLLYFLCPLDVIPDIVPVVGYLDDIGLLAMALSFVTGAGKKGEDGANADGMNPGDEEAQNLLETARHVQEGMAPLPSRLQEEDAWASPELDLPDAADNVHEQALANWAAVSADPLRRIIFTGSFSAGKSSLINALLQRPVLPASPRPCTPILTTLIKAEAGHEQAVLELKDGSVEILEDVSLVSREPEQIGNRARELTVMLNAALLSDGISLVDTCGLESTEHVVIPVEELPRSAAFIYVKGAEVGDLTKAEDDFLREISRHITSDQLIVVVNKADRSSAADVQKLKERIEERLESDGLKGVPIFVTSATGEAGQTWELDALRNELRHRAAVSIPEKEQEMARLAQKAQHLLARQREEAAAQDAETRARHREALEASCQSLIDKLEKEADKYRLAFRRRTDDYIRNSLWPEICKRVDNSSVNEALAADVRVFCRNSLGAFAKQECEKMVSVFHRACGVDELKGLIQASDSIQPFAPENHEEAVRQSSRYVLPAVAIATFFTPMGLVSWATTIALPTLVMSKLGVGEKLGDILASWGPGRKAREEFKLSLRSELLQAATLLEQEMDKLIQQSLEQEVQAIRRKMDDFS